MRAGHQIGRDGALHPIPFSGAAPVRAGPVDRIGLIEPAAKASRLLILTASAALRGLLRAALPRPKLATLAAAAALIEWIENTPKSRLSASALANLDGLL